MRNSQRNVPNDTPFARRLTTQQKLFLTGIAVIEVGIGLAVAGVASAIAGNVAALASTTIAAPSR